MTSEVKKIKKDILADPIGMYRKQKPGATADQVNTLQALHRDYRALQEKHAELDNETRALSRQIGEAKKNQQPADVLISRMQEYSKQKAEVSTYLQKIELEILDLFNLEPGDTTANSTTQAVLPAHHYRDIDALAGEISVCTLGDDQEDWDAYVNGNPAASFYHLANWRHVIRQTFGHDSHYLYARDRDGQTRGVLPLIHMHSRLFGNFMVSMPYFNYGGAVADSPAIESALVNAANRLAASLGVSHVEYRDDLPRQDMPARTDKVNMILPLPGHAEDLWQSFTPKLRAQIKRPLREQLQIVRGGLEYVDDFYGIFAQNMRDLGTPVYGKALFRNLLNAFPMHANILIVRLNNRPVAGAFLVVYGGTMEIPWASTLRNVNHLSINMLMYWEILRFAIEQQCKYFDFGRSSKDAGTYQFKKQWGAIPKQLYWHYWLANGEDLPAINPHNPKYALAIKLWQRMPVSLTRLVGPYIVKNIP